MKVRIYNQKRTPPLWRRKLTGAIRHTLAVIPKYSGGARADVGAYSTVHIYIVGKRAICVLNKRFLDENRPTDVLSFPQWTTHLPKHLRKHLGDIVICKEVAAASARRDARFVGDEIAELAIHGMLHLLGYDHDTDRARQEMRVLQARTLLRLGVGYSRMFSTGLKRAAARVGKRMPRKTKTVVVR
jgi:probable rRNA maturation factor